MNFSKKTRRLLDFSKEKRQKKFRINRSQLKLFFSVNFRNFKLKVVHLMFFNLEKKFTYRIRFKIFFFQEKSY